MPRVVVTHAVQGIEEWLAGRTERASALPGVTNVTDLVGVDGSNQAAVTFDIDDVDALMTMLSEMPADMVAQAESHGVITSTMFFYVEA